MKTAAAGETIRLVFTHDVTEPFGVSERWLLGLWQVARKSRFRLWRNRAPIALELVASGGLVHFQVHLCNSTLAELTRRLLAAHCPGIAFEPPVPLDFHEGVLANLYLPDSGWAERPLTPHPDVIQGLLTALKSDKDSALLQLLLQPSRMARDDGPVPAFYVAGRIVSEGAGALSRVRTIAGAVGQLADERRFHISRPHRLRRRELEALVTRRWTRLALPPGWLATPHQLAAVYHPPARVGALVAVLGRTAHQAPAPGGDGSIALAEARAADGRSEQLRIAPRDLLRHALVIGPSGSGKTTFLAHLAREAADSGMGVTVIDPHGGLVRELARTLPREIEPRASLLRFSDTEHVVGLNPFRATGGHPGMIADELVDVLRRIFGTQYWGPLVDLALRNAILATIAARGTIVDSARMLDDPVLRERFLEAVDNDETRRFFAGLSDAGGLDRRLLPAVHRLQRILTTPWLRNILSRPEQSLAFRELFERREVLLLDLSGLGAANARLLGSLLLLLIRSAALSRNPDASQDRPHLVLVDEASWFTGSTISELLDGARKFGVGLVLALQRVAQLPSEDLRSAVFANTANTFAFTIHDHEDATYLARHFSADVIDATDLRRLPKYEGYAQLTLANERQRPAWFRAPTPPDESPDAPAIEMRLVQRGIDRYTAPRATVEAALLGRERRQYQDDEPEIRRLEGEDAADADPA